MNRCEREALVWNQGLDRRALNQTMRAVYEHAHHKRNWRFLTAFGDVSNKCILEVGATSLWHELLAGSPYKELWCINISETELQKGRKLASSDDTTQFAIMDAHHTDFADEKFDIIFGAGILHHLDLDKCLIEFRRILKLGGWIYFYEPLDINPLAQLIRRLTPAARTMDERPFRWTDIAQLRRNFECCFHNDDLFAVPAGVVMQKLSGSRTPSFIRAVSKLDSVMASIPGIRFWMRTTFVAGQKK